LAGDLSGSSEILQELSTMRSPDEPRGQIARLKELIDCYEYDEAGAIVDGLLAGLGTGEKS
jgi:hypothetical protein